jgi:hypothetical protein
MNTRMLILVAGAALLVAGVIGLLIPVSASSGSDGKSVGCGSALISDLSEAKTADSNLSNEGADITKKVAPSLAPAIPGQTDYVGACNSALGARRTWTIPLAVIGLIVAGGSFLVRGGRARSALG